MELNFPRTPKPIQKRPLWKSAAVGLTILLVISFVVFYVTNIYLFRGAPGLSCIFLGGNLHTESQIVDSKHELHSYLCERPHSDNGQICDASSNCQGECIFESPSDQHGKCGHILFEYSVMRLK